MRPTEPVGIAAAGLWLPEGRSLASNAVAAGRLRERAAEDLGHESLPDADVTAPPDAAVRAAHLALDAAGEPAERLAVLAHAWMYHQGHDLWSPAHYVARRLGAPRALPVGVQQVCNGGAAALGFVTAWLATADSAEASRPRLGLVTTADRFAEPGFDRWASDYGVAYGDGGTAVVLRRPAVPGDALLLRSVATYADPELEEMHRGTDPFMPAARDLRERVDMRATKRSWLRVNGVEPFTTANERAIRTVVAEALADAGMTASDPRLSHVVLPRFGAKTLTESWLPVLAQCVDAQLLDFGRATGHLGAGDALAGLADLVRRGLPAPGHAALVFSAGAGFTWSCLLVESPRR
ncbi:ketoacyl-ACP synthase III family protein [Streptomyces flavofungini]|uniref:ketoacyl-ACP synthase III family protein n=1 Tax=Streptomyces flavofungini TaxID=68200 RepID=UPI0025B13FDE|nr:ketoacyl-ACP synthase III family protein [Streptomyces flavofungini]WJV47753.1 ketoacyl-ACP synthase III family protein [Streptomyces flavofungini]